MFPCRKGVENFGFIFKVLKLQLSPLLIFLLIQFEPVLTENRVCCISTPCTTKCCDTQNVHALSRLKGGSQSLDELEAMVERKERSGEINLQRYTPEQYQAMGIEGAYYDVNGCINFAPPGFHIALFLRK
jgi:hypothetical protein